MAHLSEEIHHPENDGPVVETQAFPQTLVAVDQVVHILSDLPPSAGLDEVVVVVALVRPSEDGEAHVIWARDAQMQVLNHLRTYCQELHP